MKTKRTKALIAALGIITMSLTMGVIFSIGKENMSSIKSNAEENVDDSITWSAASTCVTHTDNSRTYTEYSNRGTEIYMYSYHDALLNPENEIFMSTSNSDDYCVKFVDSGSDNPTNPFYFQYISSLSITTSARSLEGAGVQVFVFSDTDMATPIAYDDYTYPSDTIVFDSISSRHSIVIKASSTFTISSITISYSCSPSSDPIKHSIGYYSYVDGEYVELDSHITVIESSPSYGIAGEYYYFTVEVAPGYLLDDYSPFHADDEATEEYMTYIDYNVRRFMMPYIDLKIGIAIVEDV